MQRHSHITGTRKHERAQTYKTEYARTHARMQAHTSSLTCDSTKCARDGLSAVRGGRYSSILRLQTSPLCKCSCRELERRILFLGHDHTHEHPRAQPRAHKRVHSLSRKMEQKHSLHHGRRTKDHTHLLHQALVEFWTSESRVKSYSYFIIRMNFGAIPERYGSGHVSGATEKRKEAMSAT